MPSSITGCPPATALASPRTSVVPATPYMNDSPYASTAEETVPIRKNFSAASTASGSRFMKPAR